jgi:4,5:9,10-diseco-3-hydroxy-5,9,17-trioxoandrosta-1(10),2-diene-4-oate hydrolase
VATAALAVETTRRTINGVEQRVLTAGEGPPLLLLHGIGGSADEWLDVMPRFAARYRVVAADAPGHGYSHKPARHRYDVGYYVDSVLGLMDALGMAQAPIVAISGGGAVALSIALSQPARASKLVLVDAAGLGREVAWSYRVATLPFMGHAIGRSSRRSVEAFGRALLYRPDRLPEGWVDRRMAIRATEGATAAFVATARAGVSLRGQRVDFSRRLGEIRQPTLILWGRQDPIIPVAHGIAAAKAIPNARQHVFEECGHMPIWEYPEEVGRLVSEFLE